LELPWGRREGEPQRAFPEALSARALEWFWGMAVLYQ
jgi:hypothetical protein